MDNNFLRGLLVGGVTTLICTLAVITISQNINIFNLSDINKINKITKCIKEYYAIDFTKEGIVDGAIAGLFDNLDNYSRYYTKEEYKKLCESSDYVGIGVYMSKKSYSNALTVINVFEGSPAEKAGLKHGDVISKIDGVETYNLKMDDASDLVRGKQGTSVTLEYIRGDDTFEVTIKRKAIDYKYVSYDKLNDSTGYIKITSFEQSAVDDFKEALDSLGEIDNLVLDLRDNGGGDIELAKELMNIFLPDGTIATLESTDKELNGTKYTLDAGNELKYNIVVLVNENTASASEIMTSYIQENKYGVVVGQTTYGKGIYQCLMEFVDGSAMKLTLGKYYTSNGTCINGEGIEPDYKMDFTYDVYLDEIPLDDDKYVQKALELLED